MAKISPEVLWRYVVHDSDLIDVMPMEVRVKFYGIAEKHSLFQIGKHPQVGYFAIMSETGPILWAEHPEMLEIAEEQKPEIKIYSRYEILTDGDKKPPEVSKTPEDVSSKRKIHWK